MKIADIELGGKPLLLAPMEDVTDPSFRYMCKRFGGRMEEIVSPAVICAIACAIAAVISQIGDLAASAIKRNHDVKDYGHLIPGHGGVLDRFDSMIFTAPAIFFALTLLG